MWFDGACSGNPGPAGGGAIVEYDGERHVISEGIGTGTNNEAEYHGLILGLQRALELGAERVTVRGDSQLVIRQLEGRYAVKAVNLRPYFERAKGLMEAFDAVRLEWVRREQNGDADAAARRAIA